MNLEAPMIEVIIGSLSNAFFLTSIAVPFILGLRGIRLRWGILTGWGLSIISMLFQDIISPLLAFHYLGREALKRISVDQPGTAAAIFSGWFIGLIFCVAGMGIRFLLTTIKRWRSA